MKNRQKLREQIGEAHLVAAGTLHGFEGKTATERRVALLAASAAYTRLGTLLGKLALQYPAKKK